MGANSLVKLSRSWRKNSIKRFHLLHFNKYYSCVSFCPVRSLVDHWYSTGDDTNTDFIDVIIFGLC